MTLKEYNKKRGLKENTNNKEEPFGIIAENSSDSLRFVVHKHAASRLHYDLRLEMNGVYVSFAIPKGPSLDPLQQRLAVFVEDHPIDYGNFEGVIEKGYGAGTSIIWDRGSYLERNSKNSQDSEEKMRQGLAKGHMTFILSGKKLKGEFALIRLKESKNWLLIKKKDSFATHHDILTSNRSVHSNLTLEEVTAKHQIIANHKQIHEIKKSDIVNNILETKKEIPEFIFLKKLMKPSIKDTRSAYPAFENWFFFPLSSGLRCLIYRNTNKWQLLHNSPLQLHKCRREIEKIYKNLPSEFIIDGFLVANNAMNLSEYENKDSEEISFLAYDLLYLEQQSLCNEPYEVRFSTLQKRFATIAAKNVDEENSLYKINETYDLLAYHKHGIYKPGISSAFCKFTKNKDVKTPQEFSFLSQEEKVKTRKINLRENIFAEDNKLDKHIIKKDLLLTSLNKIYWPKEGLLKKDAIEYYSQISELILPQLKDRPLSLHRHPHGSEKKSFYQKDFSGYHPSFLQTFAVKSSHKGSINYALCQNYESLLYLANLGCIEFNPWLSSIHALENPNYSVIDLDPSAQNSFFEVITVAYETYKILQNIKAKAYLKTSGASGLHIYVPFANIHTYEEIRNFAFKVVQIVHEKLPKITSLERNVAKRGHRIYLDFMQNVKGQTLASAYSIRPEKGAPVSAPLHWDELTKELHPKMFHIKNMARRLEEVGDIWGDIGINLNILEEILPRLPACA